jgi:predicted DNA-binding transcriptional regulator YafY
LTLRVDNLDAMERWVLGWGAHVTVVAPAELIARVRAAADGVRKLYRS